MLASVTHDLKTPLNGIILFLDSIEKENSIDNIRKVFTIIRKNAFLLLYIIYDILDYSRLLNKRLNLVYSKFLLREVLEEVYQLF